MKIYNIIMGLVLVVTVVAGSVMTASAAPSHSGVVVSTMNAGSYTYLEVEENGAKIWVAAPLAEVSTGDKVSFPEEVWMQNFRSKTLDKVFDKILFVSTLKIGGEQLDTPVMSNGNMPMSGAGSSSHNMSGSGMGQIPKAKTSGAPEKGSIEKITDGFTVAELFEKKVSLNGKIVKVRGKVVKISRNIMGKNWIHMQDGTGSEGSNDITITSSETPRLGAVLVGEGKLAANKNFGGGYKYAAIIEEAKFHN